MSNRAKALTKRALERWGHVPRSEQEKLIEELQSRPTGSAAIELLPLQNKPWPENGLLCRAQVVALTFGVNIFKESEQRYLMLSDIPKSEESEEQ